MSIYPFGIKPVARRVPTPADTPDAAATVLPGEYIGSATSVSVASAYVMPLYGATGLEVAAWRLPDKTTVAGQVSFALYASSAPLPATGALASIRPRTLTLVSGSESQCDAVGGADLPRPIVLAAGRQYFVYLRFNANAKRAVAEADAFSRAMRVPDPDGVLSAPAQGVFPATITPGANSVGAMVCWVFGKRFLTLAR